MVSGELGNLSELQLLSFAFPECVKDKLTHLPEFLHSVLSTVSGIEHTGCRSRWHDGHRRRRGPHNIIGEESKLDGARGKTSTSVNWGRGFDDVIWIIYTHQLLQSHILGFTRLELVGLHVMERL